MDPQWHQYQQQQQIDPFEVVVDLLAPTVYHEAALFGNIDMAIEAFNNGVPFPKPGTAVPTRSAMKKLTQDLKKNNNFENLENLETLEQKGEEKGEKNDSTIVPISTELDTSTTISTIHDDSMSTIIPPFSPIDLAMIYPCNYRILTLFAKYGHKPRLSESNNQRKRKLIKKQRVLQLLTMYRAAIVAQCVEGDGDSDGKNPKSDGKNSDGTNSDIKNPNSQLNSSHQLNQTNLKHYQELIKLSQRLNSIYTVEDIELKAQKYNKKYNKDRVGTRDSDDIGDTNHSLTLNDGLVVNDDSLAANNDKATPIIDDALNTNNDKATPSIDALNTNNDKATPSRIDALNTNNDGLDTISPPDEGDNDSIGSQNDSTQINNNTRMDKNTNEKNDEKNDENDEKNPENDETNDEKNDEKKLVDFEFCEFSSLSYDEDDDDRSIDSNDVDSYYYRGNSDNNNSERINNDNNNTNNDNNNDNNNANTPLSLLFSSYNSLDQYYNDDEEDEDNEDNDVDDDDEEEKNRENIDKIANKKSSSLSLLDENGDEIITSEQYMELYNDLITMSNSQEAQLINMESLPLPNRTLLLTATTLMTDTYSCNDEYVANLLAKTITLRCLRLLEDVAFGKFDFGSDDDDDCEDDQNNENTDNDGAKSKNGKRRVQDEIMEIYQLQFEFDRKSGGLFHKWEIVSDLEQLIHNQQE